MYQMFIVTAFLFFTLLHADSDINTMCPVMPDEKIDKTIVAEYQGKKVYLCCKRCLKKFVKNPELYTIKLPQFSENKMVHSHNHYKDENQILDSNIFRFLSKFHPVSVHFPIVIILLAGFFELLSWRTKKLVFEETVRIMILLATLTSIIAVILGWLAGFFSNYPGKLGFVLQTHRWLGISTGFFIIVTYVFSELYNHKKQHRYKICYRLSLCISAITVMYAGHLGGILIYGVDYYSW